uniref:H0814G11.19 protein n=1 Tax=Oryza sativa TaxID=4530 RepID=Q00RM1_ORYSA|nr:H0814G11.19 [Oryza sativa]
MWLSDSENNKVGRDRESIVTIGSDGWCVAPWASETPVQNGDGSNTSPDAGDRDGEREISVCPGVGTGYHNLTGAAPLPSLSIYEEQSL